MTAAVVVEEDGMIVGSPPSSPAAAFIPAASCSRLALLGVLLTASFTVVAY